MRFRILFAALALAAFVEHAAAAPEPQAVVELFTSQGCSSCPPADAYLAELARRPGVIALALPVDSWDYLGWKDTLAQAAFSARQRAYASARGDRQIYTPQMVVNGVAAAVGSDRAEVERRIAGAGRPALPVDVSVAETGSGVTIEVGGAAAGGPKAAEVWLLPVMKRREVAIGRGENRGRSIAYVNVARGMTRVGAWSGQPARFEAPLASARPGDAEGYVVLVQAGASGRPGPILGAAKGPNF
jgi:hypothetical protein